MHIRISTRGDRKNVPGIPGACATHNFIYLARGPCITLIDYKLYYKSFSSAVSNVKVNPYEECIKQHHMVVCDFTTHIPHVKKCKFSPHIPTWKLMDLVTARQFQSASKLKTTITSAGASVDTANHVDSSWSKLKGAARCCHQRLQSFQEPPVKNWNLAGGQGRFYGGALRNLSVEEWAVHVIQGTYSNAQSRVLLNDQYSEDFGVGVDVHQGSVLRRLLFIPVLKTISHEFCTGVPWGLLYTDDLVRSTDTLECITELKAVWQVGMESKGLPVNMKNKFLVSDVDQDVLKKSGKCPCAVCCSDISNSSLKCSQSKFWVHKGCSGITERLGANPNYVCCRCSTEGRPINGRTLI